MDSYTVTVELDTKDDVAEQVVDALGAYHAAAGRSDRGRLSVTMTTPAEDFVQAMQTTVAITAQAVHAPVLSVEIMSTDEHDRRLGLDPVPDLVSVPEAAQILGVTRQAVLQRLGSGSLPGRQVGHAWVIPRASLAPTDDAADPDTR